jgi:serine/threonine protein kinase, bacterial
MSVLTPTSSPRRRRLFAAALTAALVAVPATASGHTGGVAAKVATRQVGNPQVVRVSPTTGRVTALAGGSPWTTLSGLAFGPSGTLYVANQGPIGPNPQGAGIYSLTDPSLAITAVASSGPTAIPTGLVSDGSTLYSLQSDRVIAIAMNAPFTQTVVSSGGLYDQYGVQPDFGTIAANTLYTTAWSSCDSVQGGGGYVIAVNLTTGTQTMVKNLGCAALGGIANGPRGTLYVAESSTNTVDGGPSAPAKIVSLNPSTGAVKPLSSGGRLKTPQGIAVNTAGDIVVADSTSGITAVSVPSGQQSPMTASGAVGGATGIAVGANGDIYVSEAGVPPTVTASATTPQRIGSSGIKFTANCNRTCTVAYNASIAIPGGRGFAQTAAFHNVDGKRTLTIKLPADVSQRIATAVRKHQKVTAKLTITPQDPRSGSPGKSVTLSLRLSK